MNSKNSKYLVQGSILAAASIISRIIGMLYRIPLNRIVGLEGMGTYSAAFEIYNLFLLLSSYSIPLAVSKLVSAREFKKEYNNAYMIFKSAMLLSVTVGGLSCIILYTGAGFWAKLAGYPSIVRPLKILAPTILVFSIMGVLRGLFQGKHTMIPTAVSQLLEQIVNAFVSVIAAYLLMKAHNASPEISTYGAAGGTMGTLVGAIFGMLFLLFLFTIYYPVLKKRLLKDKTSNRESMMEALKAVAFTAFPVIISQTTFQISGVIDTTMWGQIAAAKGMTKEELNTIWGIYSGQYKLLINVPVAVATALGTAIVPTLAGLFARQETENIKFKISTSIKFNMLIAFPAAVGLGVLAEPIILLLFGYRNFDPLTPRLMMFGAAAVVFFALSTMTNGILQGIDKMTVPVRHAAVSLAIHIPLLFVTLKVFDMGAYGLVLSNTLFAAVICVLNWRTIAKELNYKQEIVKTFLLPLVASSIMGVFTYLSFKASYKLMHSNAVSVVVSMILSVAVYGVAVLLLRVVNEEELKEMPKGNMILGLCKKLHIM